MIPGVYTEDTLVQQTTAEYLEQQGLERDRQTKLPVMVPDLTPIFCLIHIDELRIHLDRGGLHAPNHSPDDGVKRFSPITPLDGINPWSQSPNGINIKNKSMATSTLRENHVIR